MTTKTTSRKSRSALTRFKDIPEFTRSGTYEVNFHFTSLPGWIEDMCEEGLDLDPDFQRGHVWTDEQQSRFMEFHLRGGITGRVIYLNCPSWKSGQISGDEFVIVDGKQRLEAIRRFVANEIPAFGSLFREYTDRPRLMSHTMKVNVNELKTRAEVLQWYLDLNTGGVVHSDAEIDRVRKLLEKERQ